MGNRIETQVACQKTVIPLTIIVINKVNTENKQSTKHDENHCHITKIKQVNKETCFETIYICILKSRKNLDTFEMWCWWRMLNNKWLPRARAN